MQTNPAKGIDKIKTGDGYAPWPELLIERFLEEASPPVRLFMELAIGTGQRVSDILEMKWSDIEDGGIHVTQGKTSVELWIPFTPRLQAELDRTPKTGLQSNVEVE